MLRVICSTPRSPSLIPELACVDPACVGDRGEQPNPSQRGAIRLFRVTPEPSPTFASCFLEGRRADAAFSWVEFRHRTPPARLPGPPTIDLRGKTIKELTAIAVRASFERHKGNRRAMMRELEFSKSTLLRRLDELGLRGAAEETLPEE